MKKSDDLFDLINSLTKAEKRYFKLSTTSQKGNKNYAVLFDYIASQNTYNESRLKKRFKDEKFIVQLHVTKNYLYNLILKSLNQQHNEKNVKTQTTESIRKASILYDKGLHKQSIKLLKKVKKIAVEYELYPQLLEICELEASLDAKILKTSNLKETTALRQQLKEDYLFKLLNTSYLNDLYFDFFIFSKEKGAARTEEDKKLIQKIISNPLLQDESQAKTWLAKCYYYIIWTYYYWYTHLHKERHEIGLKYLNHLEENPKLLAQHIQFYAAAVQIVILSSMTIEDYDTAEQALKKYGNISIQYKVTNTALANRFLATYYNLSLNYIRKVLEIEGSSELIAEIKKVFEEQPNKLQEVEKIVIADNIAALLLIYGDYSEALYWVNLILNENFTTTRTNIQCSARIMNLIIHNEMKNYELLPYLIRNTNRYLENRQHLYNSEREILNFFKKVPDLLPKSDRQKVYTALRQSLTKILENDAEKLVFNTFNILYWIESKMGNTALMDIYKTKD